MGKSEQRLMCSEHSAFMALQAASQARTEAMFKEIMGDQHEFKDALFGNGKDGLKTKVDRLEQKEKSRDHEEAKQEKAVCAKAIRHERYAVALICLLIGTILSNVFPYIAALF